MRSLLSRYATPLTSMLFVISAVSGAAIFFGIGMRYFHSMHEWLSMLLLLPFGLHVWRNWRPLLAYFRKPAMAVAAAATLVMSAAFIVPSLGSTTSRDAPPERVVVELFQRGTIAEIAPLVGQQPDALRAGLEKKGFKVANVDVSLADVATASGKSARETPSAVLASRQ
ncbi:MAG: DUF4405 domain-containing protein [Rhizobiaceae bacterium]|nr:DUF4405 domain-containing protein [Rhizobiaceae bacterium]